MPLCKPNEIAIATQSSYAVSKAEFAEILAGNDLDAPVVKWGEFWLGFPLVINPVYDICITEFEYTPISNMDILIASLLSAVGAASLAPKVLKNLKRVLKHRLCKCKKLNPDPPEPPPFPPPIPSPPDPQPYPPGCCESCFSQIAANVDFVNETLAANLQYWLDLGWEVTQEFAPQYPQEPYINWQSTDCDSGGSGVNQATCKYYEGNGGLELSKPGSNTFSMGWGKYAFFWQSCPEDPEDPDGEGEPQLPPDPLPPDTFDFCEEFPELCNDCPEEGESVKETTLNATFKTDCGGGTENKEYKFKVKSEGADT
jgi:hypothetical protein